MIHWNTVKQFFGFGEEAANATLAIRPKPPAELPRGIRPVTKLQPRMDLKKAKRVKATTNPKHYYRRNGKYYSVSDDSLIEDMMLLYVLIEMFDTNEIAEFDVGAFTAPEAFEAPEDLLDLDVSSTPVVESRSEPSYIASESAPVRQESYSSGYSDSTSSYDSSSSDCGSCD